MSKKARKDTFNAPRAKAGGHQRWLDKGCPTIPEHRPSGVVAYYAGLRARDIKQATQRALDNFIGPSKAKQGWGERVKGALARFIPRRIMGK